MMALVGIVGFALLFGLFVAVNPRADSCGGANCDICEGSCEPEANDAKH